MTYHRATKKEGGRGKQLFFRPCERDALATMGGGNFYCEREGGMEKAFNSLPCPRQGSLRRNRPVESKPDRAILQAIHTYSIFLIYCIVVLH